MAFWVLFVYCGFVWFMVIIGCSCVAILVVCSLVLASAGCSWRCLLRLLCLGVMVGVLGCEFGGCL